LYQSGFLALLILFASVLKAKPLDLPLLQPSVSLNEML